MGCGPCRHHCHLRAKKDKRKVGNGGPASVGLENPGHLVSGVEKLSDGPKQVTEDSLGREREQAPFGFSSKFLKSKVDWREMPV